MSPLLPYRRMLALAILFGLTGPAAAMAATPDDAPACTPGVLACAQPQERWRMCAKDDLFDFYLPGLPTAGERREAAQEISAERITTPDAERYLLEGNAELRQLDLVLRAERLDYNHASTDWKVAGDVRYQDRSLLAAAARAEGNAERSECTLEGVRYQLLGTRGNGTAEVVVVADRDRANLTGTSYSTCDRNDQQWAFAAREIALDRESGIGRARDITLRIADVPVFWFPYLRFPIDERRVSGVLLPSVGFGRRRGLDLTVPYYLNLAPNYDATLRPRLMSERGAMLGAEFRYLSDTSRGSIDFDFLAHDRRANEESRQYGEDISARRWWYRWTNESRFSPTWSASANINRVSDARYFEDFGRGLYGSAVSFLPSRLYVTGRGDWWSASLGGDDYQITDPSLAAGSAPYRRLPRLSFEAQHPVAGPLDAGMDAELVAFSKDFAQDGRRADLFPYLALEWERAGWFVRPRFGYRYTSWELDRSEAAPGTPQAGGHRDRGVPILSVDAGLRFEREFDHGRWTQTLEPRAYYLRVPYRSQADIPLFDTQEIPFSFSELFRSNRFIGADRQMDANNLSLALTSRLIDTASGEERLSASIGQIRYFDEQRVQLPGRPATDWSGSTWAGELALRLSERWRFTLAQQWNPNSEHTELSAIGVQHRFADNGVVNLSYRYRRGLVDQIDISAAIPFGDGWRLVARDNYALSVPRPFAGDPRGTGGRTLERFIGVERETCCVAWRVLARQWVRNSAGERDSAAFFELELKGLGSLGQQADAFLRRAILGYR